MVTEAGKELLRNTINTAQFHNRILEENEMWKQWELECGLTMMVSDDDILKKIKKHHQCSKHRKRDKSREKGSCRKNTELRPSSSKIPDRWDHSGFHELYPDEVASKKDEIPSKKDEIPIPKKHKKRKSKHDSNSSTSDNEIWEEFKKYKKAEKEKQKSKFQSPAHFDSNTKKCKKNKPEAVGYKSSNR